MIAKGNLHAHGRKLADYLTKTDKAGERVELVELRGFASDNIHDAFTDVQIQAEGTRSTKPFFHAYIRLPDSDQLGRQQWQHVADRIEKELGFEGQPRAVAFHHQEDGTTHMHMAWSRIDTEAMQAIDPGLYKNKLKQVSRELEQELGITQVSSERDPQDKTRSATRNEFEQARRLDTNLKEIRETIRDCWDRSDDGKSFTASLEEKDLVLARGDRRDFVVVDHEGGDHALGKRITGATAAETRERLADLDRAALPSVDQAKELQRARVDDRAQVAEPSPAPTQEREREAPPLSKTAGEIRLAWALTQSGAGVAAAIEDRGYTVARVTGDDARQSERAAAFARELGRYTPTYKEGEIVVINNFGSVYRIDPKTTGETRAEIDSYLQTVDRNSLLSVTDARAAMKEATQIAFRDEQQRARPITATETKINSAVKSSRTGQDFIQALDKSGLALGRATAADIAALRVEHAERLADAFHFREDPNAKAMPDSVSRIQEGELVAVDKFGGMHRLNPQKIDVTRVENFEHQARGELRTLGEVRTEKAAAQATFWNEHRERQDTATEARIIAGAERRAAQHARIDAKPAKDVGKAADAGFRVGSNVAGAVADRLADFVGGLADLLSGSTTTPHEITPAEYATSAKARRAYHQQQAAERDALQARSEALDQIRDDIKDGRSFDPATIRSLSRDDLLTIKANGDDGLRQIVEVHEREQKQQREDVGRERER
jgi:ribosomal protein L20